MGRAPANPLESAGNAVKGAMDAVGGLFKSGWDIGMHPDQWSKEWGRIISSQKAKEDLYDGSKEVGKQAISQLVDPFRGDDGGFSMAHALWNDPFGALNTIYLLKDAVGDAAQATGKAAGGTSYKMLRRLKINPEDLVGPLSGADKLVQAGEAVSDFKPFTQGAKALLQKTGARVPLDYLGVAPPTEEGRTVKGMIAQIKAQEAQKEFAVADALAKYRLTPEEVDQYNNLADLGRQQDIDAASPNVKSAFQTYNDKLRTPAEADYEGLVTPEQKLTARAQQAAQRLFGDMSAEHVSQAKEMMALPEGDPNRLDPTYRHMATQKGEWLKGVDRLIQEITGIQDTSGRNINGTVGTLETRVGGGDYITNPLEAALVQNRVNTQFRIRRRMIREVTEYLAQRGMARAIPAGGALSPGEEIAPTEMWKKYDDTSARAATVAITRKLQGMGDAASTGEALTHILTDPALKGEIDNAKNIVLPRWAAKRLALELKFPRPIGRTYDKIESLWKANATIFRPAYWMNVAAGNGTLAALHGVNLGDAMRSVKLRDALPAELKGSRQFVTPYQNPAMRAYRMVASNLSQLDQGLHHTQVHNPIYFKGLEAGRRASLASTDAIYNAGKSFFLSQEVLNNPELYAKAVAMGHDEWQNAIGQKAQLQEQMARNSYRMMELERQRVASQTAFERAQEAFGRSQTERPGKVVGEFNAGPPAEEGPAEVYPRGSSTKEIPGKRAPFEAGTLPEEAPANVYPDVEGKPLSANAAKLIKEMSEHQQTALGLEEQINGLKAEALDKASRAGMVRENLPALEKLRELSEQAIEPLNRFGGDYGRLHPLERTFLRRAVPFWAWQKAMTRLVFTLPTAYPMKTFLWNRLGRMMWDSATDEQHPEWLQGSVPLFQLQDGDTLYSRPFWNPLDRVKPSHLGDVPVPDIFDVWKQNNWLKVAMDLKGGYNQYTMKPFDAPINGVRLDTGEMYKLDPSGKATKTLFQPSLLRSLYSLFPWSQYIDHILLPASQSSRGWIGNPSPQLNPDGTPMHPTTLLQRLRDVLTPFRQTNFEDADRFELSKQVKAIKTYEESIYKERDPERRDAMIKILQDYVEMFSRKQR